MRTESLASSQSCRNVDADAWFKPTFSSRVKLYWTILEVTFVLSQIIHLASLKSWYCQIRLVNLVLFFKMNRFSFN